MKSLKHILFGFSLIGLFAACSSDDNNVQEPAQPDNSKWSAIGLNMGVEQGTPTTRTIGDLDNQGLPKGAYPSDLAIYIHGYQNGNVKGSITLNQDGEDNGGKANFYYYLDTRENVVRLKSTVESGEELAVTIKDKDADWTNLDKDGSMFFFASQPEINNVEFPKIDPAHNLYESLYPNAHDEFGDKLFCTDGYVFKWKDESTVALYLVVRNDYHKPVVKEIKEIMKWQKGDWDLTMKRLTACVSIRLMVIDSYVPSGNTTIHKNIAGMDRNDIPFAEGVTKTNDAMREYVAANHSEFTEDFANFNIENMLVRKKLLTNFPIIYNWKEGLVKGEESARGNLYLCNLDHPAWIDAVTNYEHGENDVHALTATCNNEPFVAADFGDVGSVDLVLFLGYGQRDKGDRVQGGTYDRLISLTIPFGQSGDTGSNPYHVTPNTRTYVYVGITLEDLFQLYKRLYIDEIPESATRGESAISNYTISPKQLIVTSEPYITE